MVQTPANQTPTTALGPLTSLRMVVGTMMWALIIIGVAFFFVVPIAPPAHAWSWAVIAVVAGAAAMAMMTVGFNVQPLPPGLSPVETGQRSLMALRTSTIVRAALGEVTAIVAVALSVIEGSWLLLAAGLAVSLLLMGVLAWPGSWAVERVQAKLDANGGHSGLLELTGRSGPLG